MFGSAALVGASSADGEVLPTGENLTILDSYPDITNLNQAYGVAIDESTNTAYVVSRTSKSISAFNVADPNNITIISTFPSADLGGDSYVILSGSVAFVACVYGLISFDISDPSSMSQLHKVASVDLHEIVIVGTTIFGANRQLDAIVSFNVSNPSSMAIVQTLSDAGLNGARGIAIKGNYAYIGTTYSTVGIIDITSSSAMLYIGAIPLTLVYALHIIDDTLFFVSSALSTTQILNAYDLSTPSAPSFLGNKSTTDLYGCQSLTSVGTVLFSANFYDDSLASIDVSNTSSMVVIDTLTSSQLNGATDVALLGNTAFVTSYEADRLVSIDIT